MGRDPYETAVYAHGVSKVVFFLGSVVSDWIQSAAQFKLISRGIGSSN